MDKITLLVTGSGGGGIGEQVIKCLKLSQLQLKIIATDITPVSKGSIDSDEFIVAPLATNENFITFILNICSEKKVNAIIPGSEIELKVFSKNRDLFEKDGIELLINSSDVIKTCLDKNLTQNFLTENGLDCPVSFAVSSLDAIKSITIFPLVLKPSVGGGGSVNTFIAQNKEELQIFSEFLLKQYSEFIAQEYIGSAESEYTVGVLSSSSGEIVDSIVLKRNILSGLGSKIKLVNNSGKADLGKYLAISSGISQGEIVKQELIAATCEKVALKLKSVGPLNIQCRLANNKVYIFEINPRFSGTSPMRALAGFNELEITIKDKILKQKQSGRVSYKLGHVVRGLSEHFIG